eukprot:TRINITY_DN96975_c0_g1_i1.p1 TRINITY_DN96975_c0_g1~~TRINITY_DN96975_c0_g1_i1.p1  ORF type:complete len:134 (+),score=0.01 TRINITY_DN96975_c0_g1_i1:94-495(+)
MQWCLDAFANWFDYDSASAGYPAEDRSVTRRALFVPGLDHASMTTKPQDGSAERRCRRAKQWCHLVCCLDAIRRRRLTSSDNVVSDIFEQLPCDWCVELKLHPRMLGDTRAVFLPSKAFVNQLCDRHGTHDTL